MFCLASGAGACAQTVQLPSFRWFSVNTSVLVPDRGGAYLGGVSRSVRGSTRYGTPGPWRLTGNRSLSGSASGGATTVHATVIDHAAMDRAVLAEAARRRGARPAGSGELAAFSRDISAGARSQTATNAGLMSVAEIRQRNAQRKAAEQHEAEQFFAQGQQAEQQGRHGAAKIYYQMALRRCSGDLKKQVAGRLKQLAQRPDARRSTPHR
jgi:hypothetical protein